MISAIVSAETLPGLPGVPAVVGPVQCPGCQRKTATVHHILQSDGDVRARVDCSHCDEVTELWMEAYSIGLSVGVLVEAARRGDPRITDRATAT
jgi:hypothetical protein